MSLEIEYDGLPNDRKFMDDVRALIADGHNGLMLFDRAKGAVEPYLTRDLLEPFLGLNDLKVDGTDVSWIWDVDFEMLKDKAQLVIPAGARALAVMLYFPSAFPFMCSTAITKVSPMSPAFAAP